MICRLIGSYDCLNQRPFRISKENILQHDIFEARTVINKFEDVLRQNKHGLMQELEVIILTFNDLQTI